MAGYSDIQVMMTLAGLCYAGQNKLPLETVDHQERRILNSPQALDNPALATGTDWRASWVGLSDDRANMSYLARNAAENMLAVAFRGTDFKMVIDRDEDFKVSSAVAFDAAGPSAGRISQGSIDAFNEITTARFDSQETTLFDALRAEVEGSPGIQIFITGHSLGGAIATTVGLYLDHEARTLGWDATLKVFTFAAPTAVLADFAGAFNAAFPETS